MENLNRWSDATLVVLSNLELIIVIPTQQNYNTMIPTLYYGIHIIVDSSIMFIVWTYMVNIVYKFIFIPCNAKIGLIF